MKFLLSFIIALFCIPSISFAKKDSVIVTYKYKKSGAKTKSITFGELQKVYQLTKRQTPLYPPAPQQFFKDYLRFKIGSEVALYDKNLVKSPKFIDMVVNPFLKESIRQELYKALAESKLQKQTQSLVKKTRNLSDRQMKLLYAKNPQFNFFYISIDHPFNGTKKQVQEARSRAQKVYAQVVKSKKPFPELVSLYSDNKQAGLLNWNQTKASIHPTVYKSLQKMGNGSISRPIKVSGGFVIVKLNAKIPYSKNVHAPAVKENYFAKNRTDIFNRYMDSLQRKFTVSYKNRSLIKSLK